jgi:serine/threonine protein kinase/tetratricopeptide (TPR) repeat protein
MKLCALPWLDALAPADALLLEKLCTEFEAALRQGQRPPVEQYRKEVSDALWPALLRELLALSEAYRQTQVIHANDNAAPLPQFVAAVVSSGMCLGPYKLLEQIGEGGMGTVWLAEQVEPVKRFVALKLIKPGMDGTQILARFETERQALALMDHPNIARVLDAGTVSSGQWAVGSEQQQVGSEENATNDRQQHAKAPLPTANGSSPTTPRPYFVMELVKGVPITKYCENHQLTTQQRLELLVPVCQAIQHAHQKGIIHRDIKPSNVLVTTVDGKPAPKVIDFGLAKAAGQRLTERTLFTGLGVIVGTLEYMSPEQAEFNAVDIDTRSDIYALGVLLYELLTGTTPLTPQQLHRASLPEALRMIREEEPPTPSTRLRQGKETRQAAGVLATHEPTKLARQVRGELDWVVMKALEKDRNRRYETANAMALDIQRYLRDEPVLAGPPSAVYRLRKFARRHKRSLVAATLVLVALLTGTIGTAVGLVKAQRQRDAAVVAEQQARTAEVQAQKAVGFLQDFVLAAARPKGQQGGLGVDASIRAAIDAAEPRIGDRFRDSPMAEAAVRHSLGATYHCLGLPKQAATQFARALELRRSALGDDHALTLASMNGLALAYQAAGRLRDALPLLEETARRCHATLGPDDPATLTSMTNLAVAYQVAGRWQEAVSRFEENLQRRQTTLGPDHLDTINSMHNLAGAYKDAGRLGDAVALFEKTVKLSRAKLGSEHPDTLSSMSGLAGAYLASGRLREASDLHEETLQKRKVVLGPDHPATRTSVNNLAQAYQEMGRLQEAVELFEKTLTVNFASQGAEHPDTLTGIHNLASAYLAAGRWQDALPLFEAALKSRQSALGDEHPDTLGTMSSLAGTYQAAGRLDDALALWEKTCRLRQAGLGEDHPDTLHSMNNLAGAYQSARQYKKALGLFEETLKRRQAKLGSDHPDTLISMNNLALVWHVTGRPSDALKLWEETLKLHRDTLGSDHPSTLHIMNNLAGAYQAAGRFGDAEPLFNAASDGARVKLGIAHPKTQMYLANLARCQEALGQPEKAESHWRELAAYWKDKAGANSLQHAAQLVPLGNNLLDQMRYDDAEPLLLQSYDSLARQGGVVNQTVLTAAMEAIVKLYESTGQQDKAQQWRKKLQAESKK